mmetsp:Transcript_17914/g.50076  ORF Transcript_17914/g.50076 Transcript_17914/m.50076 type:complete len:528 (+) Transcript_17914:832-2415(+)|eukprot:CAMPEP_0202412168 /NCGR_PEP_ID=MMETSP1128-20130828/24599_1 /ASSEMBLY_ACC=CAM_ASM_000463 /TAXON_ID=3047 /ORGANISM="Dunaliella tertiolecta, Strain CCMP1320" /LENGTH=527 /DNA_ID=CAMNT_0049018025 /DNA_START=19 /DNA_END=1602 /DNA_ORIENTATION=+
MDETSDLLNLPDDCLFLILSPQPGGSRNGLQPGDVATVGLTCKRLSDFVKRDNLWAEYCQHWLDSNHHAWEIPPELGGERLQARQLLLSLMLPSFRSLMAGLHKLGGSPVGLWHPTKDQTQGKCEGLLFVSATEPSSRSSAGFGNIPYPHLVGSLVEWNETPDGMSFKPEHKTFFSVVLGSEAPAAAAEQVEFPLVLPSLSLMGRLKHATAASFQAMAPPAISTPTATTGATPPHPAAAPTGQDDDEETVTWDVAPALLVNTRDLDVEFSAALTFSENKARMTLEVIMEHSLPQQSNRLRSTRKVVPFHFRRVVGLPDDSKLLLRPAKPSSTRDDMQHGNMQTILAELQGLWTAQYAIHGAEVLHVQWFTGCCQDSEQPFPLGGTRLEGRKLVGDPNVPSEELSFVVNPFIHISGRYDGVAVATGMPDERVAVSSSLAGFQVVELQSREDICCRFSALGQINEIPGIWQPSWENAELILYSDESGHVDIRRFSILWRPAREEQDVLQIMDFQPLKLSARPTWLSRSN